MHDDQVDPAYRTWYPAILRVCLHHLGDRDDAEDAAQETFRRALQQDLAALDDPQRWLTTVARHICFDELRRRRTGRAALQRTSGHAAAGDDPERVVVGGAFVRELLARLTPAERRVVEARLVDDRSGPELAAALGVAPSTARVLLHRGLGKLRVYLAESQAALGGAAASAWRTARGVRGALPERLRLLTGSTGSDGPSLAQGLAALLGAAIATLCLCLPGSGGHVASAAAAGPAPSGVAPRLSAVAVHAAPAARVAPGADRRPAGAGRIPSAPGAAAQAPPPPPGRQRSLIPSGPIAQNPSSPGQGIHLVGPVYLEVVPGPWFSQACSYAPDNVQVHVGAPDPQCRALPSA